METDFSDSVYIAVKYTINNSRNKRASAFLLCFIGFETINFYIFFTKMSFLGSNFFFKR